MSLRQSLIESGENPDTVEAFLTEYAENQFRDAEKHWPSGALAFSLIVADFMGEDISAQVIEETKQFRLYPIIDGIDAAIAFYQRNLPKEWHYILRLVPELKIHFPRDIHKSLKDRWDKLEDYMWSVPLLEECLFLKAMDAGMDKIDKSLLDRDSLYAAAERMRYMMASWQRSERFGILRKAPEHWTTAAAKVGSLVCLRYLHKIGCPWDKNCTRAAARAGSLECLHYAHENGCP
jgi:hypothetical protein